MKAYISPKIYSYKCISTPVIAASRIVVDTQEGGFYECGRTVCQPKDYTWTDNDDSRNIYRWVNYRRVKYQYIGCYEYKSNGSGVTQEYFHGYLISEGMQYDLYVDASNNYYVDECADGKHSEY